MRKEYTLPTGKVIEVNYVPQHNTVACVIPYKLSELFNRDVKAVAYSVHLFMEEFKQGMERVDKFMLVPEVASIQDNVFQIALFEVVILSYVSKIANYAMLSYFQESDIFPSQRSSLFSEHCDQFRHMMELEQDINGFIESVLV